MQGQLYEYQRRAVDFILEHPYCGVFVEPDMEKENIGLNAIWQLQFDRFEKAKIAVIGISGFEVDWVQEFDKNPLLANMRYTVVNRKESDVDADICFMDEYVAVKVAEKKLWNFTILIIDDLTRLKKSNTKLFSCIYKMRANFNRIIGFLPEENNIRDLWAEWLILDGGYSLGTDKSGFYEKFFLYTDGKFEDKNDTREAIYKLISHNSYHVNKVSLRDVPVIRYKHMLLSLDDKEYSKYRWFARGNSCYYELMQLANGVWCDDVGKAYCLHERKVKELKRICRKHKNKKVLVLCWFPQDMQMIIKNFSRARIISSCEDANVWNRGEIQIGILSPMDKNLFACLLNKVSVIVWYSLTESVDLYTKVNRHLITSGKNGENIVYHLIVKGTVDEELAEAYIG